MDKILITGKTGFFSEEALRYIAGTFSVLLTGADAEIGERDLPDAVRTFSAGPQDEDFARVFELGQIRAVWYVTGCADGGRAADEGESLETVLTLCANAGVERLIVLTESTDPTDYRKLIGEYGHTMGDEDASGITVVRLPLMTGTGSGKGRLDRIFRAMDQQKTVRLTAGGIRQISVLPVMDLTAMLLRMTSETGFSSGIYAADGTGGSPSGLRDILLTVCPGAEVVFADEEKAAPQRAAAGPGRGTVRFRIPVTGDEACDGQLTGLCRYPVRVNWHTAIAAQYNGLQERAKSQSPFKRALTALPNRFGSLVVPALDLVVMFILAEALSRITSESVYFKIVDVRLLFVVLMGMMHGLMIGTTAALLECIVLVIRYAQIGTSGLLLFYNVENWIPFVYYLTAGIISGYTNQKHVQERKSVSAENALIRSKYLFLNEAYRTSVSERAELRTQILSEEESYARLYGAVQRMNQRTPEAVFVEAVGVMRSLLENETVTFYQLDGRGRKADLLSCCRENALRTSIDTAVCPEMMHVIRDGKIWKNTKLQEDVPMYASMVRYSRAQKTGGNGRKEMELIVAVEQAGQDQYSTWYMNHFSILCGLLQDALDAASLRERVLS